MLAVTDLTVELESDSGLVRAIDGLNLAIERGETFALVGESGCGKSMTALALMRLLPDNGYVAAGDVHLDGDGGPTDVLALPESAMRRVRGRRVGMIFQEPSTSLNPVMKVGRQIVEAIEAHTALRGAAARAKAVEWLHRVGIPEPERRIDDYPFRMSGGQKQRVMIAIALAAEPDFLVADEPTTALDVTIQAQILDLLRDLQREQGLGLLLITHDLAVVSGMAHRVALMYAGQIVEVAPAADFFARPRHPYAQALLRALPGSTRRAGALEAIAGTVPPLTQAFVGCRFEPRCAHAMVHCATRVPALAAVAPSHAVRCWLYESVPGMSGVDPVPGATLGSDRAPAGVRAVAGPLVMAGPSPALAGSAPGGNAGVPRRGATTDRRGASPAPVSASASAPPGAVAAATTMDSGAGTAAGAISTSAPATASPQPLATSNAPLLLDVRELTVRFPIRGGLTQRVRGTFDAVRQVSFEVAAGQTLALVGESGCGKTTTGKAIVQLLRRSAAVSGQALLDGQDLVTLDGEALRAARRKLQIIFQDPFASLNPRMRVLDLLDEGLAALQPDLTAADRRGRLERLTEQVGLRRDALQRYPHEFSGGQRQRIAIARALAVEPRLIVCDEPTSALDVSVQAQILNLLRDLQQRLGVSYLFITHNIGVVESIADRVAVMQAGRIVEQGSAEEVLQRPREAYTRALLAAVPRLSGG